MATPKIGLQILTESQEDKELTVNANSYRLDAIVNGVLAQQTTPPGSPASGDAYIVSATATGAWAGQENKIAFFYNGGWTFIAPASGLCVFLLGTPSIVYYSGSWITLYAASSAVLALPTAAASLSNNAVYRVKNSGRSLTLSNTFADGFTFTSIPDDNKYTWTATASGTAFRDKLSDPITSPATIAGSAVFTYDGTANQWVIFQ